MTYLNELEQALVDLPEAEQESIVEYYRSYFADGRLSDEEARKQLGQPSELAKKLKKDLENDDVMFNKNIAIEPDKGKNKAKKQLFIWLLILTSPAWLSVLIVTFLLIVLLPLLSWLLALLLIVLSAFSGIAGVVVLPQEFWGGLFYIGAAVALLGLSIMFAPCATWLVMKATDWGKAILVWVRQLLKRVQEHE